MMSGMALSFTVRWYARRDCYRARWWDSATGFDRQRMVPKTFWAERGMNSPEFPSAKHEQLAMQWAASQIETIRSEASGTPDRKMGLGEVFALYQRENPRKVSEATRKKDRVDWKNLSRHVSPRLFPEDIDEATATIYRNQRECEDPAPRQRTIRNELSLLKRLVKFAWRWKSRTGMASINLHELPVIELEDTRQVALTHNEVQSLVEHPTEFNARRNRQLMIVGICTMLRKSNLLGLRKEWVDLERQWLSIPKEFMKGRRTQRKALEVPICMTVATILRDVGEDSEGSPYFWPNPETGKPLTWLEGSLEKWSKAAGVRPFSLHDWRTTGNTWLYHRGVDELVRGILMGHSTTGGSATSIYTHVFESYLRQAVAIFDELFSDISRGSAENSLVTVWNIEESDSATN